MAQSIKPLNNVNIVTVLKTKYSYVGNGYPVKIQLSTLSGHFVFNPYSANIRREPDT